MLFMIFLQSWMIVNKWLSSEINKLTPVLRGLCNQRNITILMTHYSFENGCTVDFVRQSKNGSKMVIFEIKRFSRFGKSLYGLLLSIFKNVKMVKNDNWWQMRLPRINQVMKSDKLDGPETKKIFAKCLNDVITWL